MTDLVPADDLAPTELNGGFLDIEGRSQIPSSTMANACVAIRLLGYDCRYDRFRDRRLFNGEPVSDKIGRRLRMEIRNTFMFDPGRQNVMDAIFAMCERNSFHPIIDQLEATRWDGVPRADKWLTTYMRTPDTEFNRSVGRLVLTAAVRRILVPGTKFDLVMVLEGPEGCGKSSALRLLFGADYFTDQTILGVHDKELQEVLRGRWCVEIAELAGLKKTELEKVKAAITREIDRARPAYGIATEEVSRSMVMIGTTNDAAWLRALSGKNRRFVPVECGRVDFKALERDRAQLWAEIFEDEPLFGSLSLPEKLWAEADALRASRTQIDPWEDILADVAEHAAKAQTCTVSGDDDQGEVAIYEKVGDEDRVSTSYILTDALGKVPGQQTPSDRHRVSLVMQKLGWEAPKMRRIHGKAVRAYARRVAVDEFADLM